MRDFSGRATGSTSGADTATRAPARRAPADARVCDPISRTALLMCRMCSGVVPQHPPTKRTPLLMNRLAYDAMYSGEHK
jgi:hypothetical protein